MRLLLLMFCMSLMASCGLADAIDDATELDITEELSESNVIILPEAETPYSAPITFEIESEEVTENLDLVEGFYIEDAILTISEVTAPENATMDLTIGGDRFSDFTLPELLLKEQAISFDGDDLWLRAIVTDMLDRGETEIIITASASQAPAQFTLTFFLSLEITIDVL